jgi:hypothetical protein
MTIHQLLGFAAAILIVGFAVFAFRQGFKTRPDRNNRQDGGMPPGGLGPGAGMQ